MSGHLSDERISRWLVEGPSEQDASHVNECELCRSELARAQAPMAILRESLTAWSEAQPVRTPGRLDTGRSWRWYGVRYLAASSAVVMTVLALVAGMHMGNRSALKQVSSVHQAQPPVPDAVLMQQVDEEVSEAVPDAMAPLTDLVAWDSTDGVSRVESEKPPTRRNDGNEKKNE